MYFAGLTDFARLLGCTGDDPQPYHAPQRASQDASKPGLTHRHGPGSPVSGSGGVSAVDPCTIGVSIAAAGDSLNKEDLEPLRPHRFVTPARRESRPERRAQEIVPSPPASEQPAPGPLQQIRSQSFVQCEDARQPSRGCAPCYYPPPPPGFNSFTAPKVPTMCPTYNPLAPIPRASRGFQSYQSMTPLLPTYVEPVAYPGYACQSNYLPLGTYAAPGWLGPYYVPTTVHPYEPPNAYRGGTAGVGGMQQPSGVEGVPQFTTARTAQALDKSPTTPANMDLQFPPHVLNNVHDQPSSCLRERPHEVPGAILVGDLQELHSCPVTARVRPPPTPPVDTLNTPRALAAVSSRGMVRSVDEGDRGVSGEHSRKPECALESAQPLRNYLHATASNPQPGFITRSAELLTGHIQDLQKGWSHLVQNGLGPAPRRRKSSDYRLHRRQCSQGRQTPRTGSRRRGSHVPTPQRLPTPGLNNISPAPPTARPQLVPQNRSDACAALDNAGAQHPHPDAKSNDLCELKWESQINATREHENEAVKLTRRTSEQAADISTESRIQRKPHLESILKEESTQTSDAAGLLLAKTDFPAEETRQNPLDLSPESLLREEPEAEEVLAIHGITTSVVDRSGEQLTGVMDAGDSLLYAGLSKSVTERSANPLHQDSKDVRDNQSESKRSTAELEKTGGTPIQCERSDQRVSECVSEPAHDSGEVDTQKGCHQTPRCLNDRLTDTSPLRAATGLAKAEPNRGAPDRDFICAADDTNTESIVAREHELLGNFLTSDAPVEQQDAFDFLLNHAVSRPLGFLPTISVEDVPAIVPHEENAQKTLEAQVSERDENEIPAAVARQGLYVNPTTQLTGESTHIASAPAGLQGALKKSKEDALGLELASEQESSEPTSDATKNSLQPLSNSNVQNSTDSASCNIENKTQLAEVKTAEKIDRHGLPEKLIAPLTMPPLPRGVSKIVSIGSNRLRLGPRRKKTSTSALIQDTPDAYPQEHPFSRVCSITEAGSPEVSDVERTHHHTDPPLLDQGREIVSEGKPELPGDAMAGPKNWHRKLSEKEWAILRVKSQRPTCFVPKSCFERIPKEFNVIQFSYSEQPRYLVKVDLAGAAKLKLPTQSILSQTIVTQTRGRNRSTVHNIPGPRITRATQVLQAALAESFQVTHIEGDYFLLSRPQTAIDARTSDKKSTSETDKMRARTTPSKAPETHPTDREGATPRRLFVKARTIDGGDAPANVELSDVEKLVDKPAGGLELRENTEYVVEYANGKMWIVGRTDQQRIFGEAITPLQNTEYTHSGPFSPSKWVRASRSHTRTLS